MEALAKQLDLRAEQAANVAAWVAVAAIAAMMALNVWLIIDWLKLIEKGS